VNEVIIRLSQHHFWHEADSGIKFLQDLAQFLKTTDCIESAWFFYFSLDEMRRTVLPSLLDELVTNRFIKQLKFHDNIELNTREVVKILQMPSIRKLGFALHGALDSQVVADAFGANSRLEYLLSDDLTVVEAVLPRLSASSSLSELVVSGGRLSHTSGLPCASTPPNSLACMSAVGHMLSPHHH
jgi:hypothetical protein